MNNLLIAVDTDLASDIALRYTCFLEEFFKFNVQLIHCPDADDKGHSPGSGWVHQKWENAVVHQAQREISQRIPNKILSSCISEPKIIPGQRNPMIFEQMRDGRYDLFIEGFLHAFDPDRFFLKLESDLYKNLLQPVLMVKNLIAAERGVQIVGTPDTLLSVLPWFLDLFQDFEGYPDVLICLFDPTLKKLVAVDNDNGMVSEIQSRLEKKGKKTGEIKTVQGPANELSLLVRDHAVSMCQMPQSGDNMSVMMSMSPLPVMFCPKFKTA